jgi:hypothetical protein
MNAGPKRDPHEDDPAESARRHQEEALDDALENTFPASDPVSIEQPTARYQIRYADSRRVECDPHRLRNGGTKGGEGTPLLLAGASERGRRAATWIPQPLTRRLLVRKTIRITQELYSGFRSN